MQAPSRLGLAVALLTGACTHPASAPASANGSASSSGSAAGTAPANSARNGLTIHAMHLDLVSGSEQRALVELRDDGSIYANGQLAARISGSQLLRPEGAAIVTIAPDGQLVRNGRAAGFTLGEHGELLTDEGRLEISADRTVVAISNDGTRESTGLRFDRVPEDAQRTAGLLVFIGLALNSRRNTRRGPPIAIPSHTRGELAASDTRLSDDSVADDYTLTLRAGHPVTIVVRGGIQTSAPPPPPDPSAVAQTNGHLDMYTILMFNGNEVTHDDDSAGSFNSRIVYTPTVDGDYTVRITTYGAGLRTGDYEIDVLDGAVPTAH